VPVSAFLASIPSPHNGVVDVGPLSIHMYGLMLLAGIAACLWLTGIRWVHLERWSAWVRAHGGPAPASRDWDLIFRVAVWGVGAGIVGARLYHDVTSWNQDSAIHAHWYGPFAIWQGGLGVWGGILFGVLMGAWIVHRAGHSVLLMMEVVAPGLLLAQAIGRWGNWWNQELFGKPTSLPWGLEIDNAHLPPAYAAGTHFHPTFLYEFVYDLIGVALLLWLGRRFRIRPPALFALYVSFYCFGRFFEELLRIDPSHEFLGLRINAWVSIVVFAASTGFFVWWQFLRKPKEGARTQPQHPPSGPTMAVPKGRVRHQR
jgi:prolipoprotein diacylglyceryl transferase